MKMVNNRSFYIAHPLPSKHKVRQWQLDVELKVGAIFINPFYDEWGEAIKLEKSSSRYEVNAQWLVERDLNLIAKSDGIIAIIDGNMSYGTIMEIVYAKLFKKPVFLVITNSESKHPWFRYHADKIFSNFKELEEHIIKTNIQRKNKK